MLFCNLNALPPTERAEHQRLAVRLAESILTAVEVEEGYAFDVDASG